jgi:hypothetical protein
MGKYREEVYKQKRVDMYLKIASRMFNKEFMEYYCNNFTKDAIEYMLRGFSAYRVDTKNIVEDVSDVTYFNPKRFKECTVVTKDCVIVKEVLTKLQVEQKYGDQKDNLKNLKNEEN